MIDALGEGVGRLADLDVPLEIPVNLRVMDFRGQVLKAHALAVIVHEESRFCENREIAALIDEPVVEFGHDDEVLKQRA